MLAPCKDCEFRSVGCHAKCDVYKTWKSEHEARQKKALDNNEAYGVINVGKVKRSQHWHKNHHNNK